MTIYHYEGRGRDGQGNFDSDEQAIAAWSGIPGLLVIYAETADGDIRIIWERK